MQLKKTRTYNLQIAYFIHLIHDVSALFVFISDLRRFKTYSCKAVFDKFGEI